MKAGATVACVRCLILIFSASVLATAGGCHSRPLASSDNSLGYYELMADQIEYPDVDLPLRRDVMEGLPPHTLRNDQERTYWDLTLQEAVRIALENSQVMRDIGASVLRAPASSSTVFDPAIQETDPRSGTEAALSAFDADLGTSLFFGRNQRTFNNLFFGGGSLSFEQQTGQFQADVTKQTAAGTQFTVRNLTTYDRNNSAANLFSSAWNVNLEAEFRHPLAQGGGIEFNRIAGPNATPGNYNGVLISRIRTDITLTDFEQAVRDLVADVERTYWNLHFAYRNLDATIQGRDAALRTWQVIRGQFEARVADREQESLARERYFAAQAATENALSGTADASSGGVFAVQRQLRFLMGLPSNDGSLIRPADEPMTVDMLFDWQDSLFYALTRRVELRRQQWTIRQRELELTAARNFLRMRLDFLGLYRRNGFGDDLMGNSGTPFSSAYESIFTDSLDDWQIGFELRTPIGNRIGHTAARNAELRLVRARAIYRDQELQVSHELSGALAELDRAYRLTRTNYNRKIASREQVDAIQRKFDAGVAPLEFVLDAIRRATEADIAYYRSLVDYNVAVVNVHLARGSLLSSHSVYLTEGAWAAEAYAAAARPAHRFQRRGIAASHTVPPPVSRGAYPQRLPNTAGGIDLEAIAPGELEVHDAPGKHARSPVFEILARPPNPFLANSQ